MRIVYMGTPEYAATILRELASWHEVVAVYTRPDAVRGRGNKLVGSPVKQLALELGIPVMTPSTLRDEVIAAEIAGMNPDVICVAAYGAILPKSILDIPPMGCFNVHASSLPRWRGAAPIERAILSGDEDAGVCVMKMEEGLDTGDYCICRTTFIEDKTAEELTDELANLGANALLTALEFAAAKRVPWVVQNEDEVTYANKVEKGELNLDPAETALVNRRRVQASSDAHAARCVIAGKGVTILKVKLFKDEDGFEPMAGEGMVAFERKRFFLGCADGLIEVLSVKPDGKKEMDARSFAAGIQGIKLGTTEWTRTNG